MSRQAEMQSAVRHNAEPAAASGSNVSTSSVRAHTSEQTHQAPHKRHQTPHKRHQTPQEHAQPWSETKNISVAALCLALVLGITLVAIGSFALNLAITNSDDLTDHDTGQHVFDLIRAHTIEVHQLNGLSAIHVGDDIDMGGHRLRGLAALTLKTPDVVDPTLWVDSVDGLDTNPGTLSAPLATLDGALALLASPRYTGRATIRLFTERTFSLGDTPRWDLRGIGLVSLTVQGTLSTSSMTSHTLTTVEQNLACEFLEAQLDPAPLPFTAIGRLFTLSPADTEGGQSAWIASNDASLATLTATADMAPVIGSTVYTHRVEQGSTFTWSGQWTLLGGDVAVSFQRLALFPNDAASPLDAGFYMFDAEVVLLECIVRNAENTDCPDSLRPDHWGRAADGIAGVSYMLGTNTSSFLGVTPRARSTMYRCLVQPGGTSVPTLSAVHVNRLSTEQTAFMSVLPVVDQYIIFVPRAFSATNTFLSSVTCHAADCARASLTACSVNNTPFTGLFVERNSVLQLQGCGFSEVTFMVTVSTGSLVTFLDAQLNDPLGTTDSGVALLQGARSLNTALGLGTLTLASDALLVGSKGAQVLGNVPVNDYQEDNTLNCAAV